MRKLIAGNLLVFSCLCLGFRIEDLFDNHKNINYQHQLPDERQDFQSPDVLISAFITTFIASSITNLLFPRIPLASTVPTTTARPSTSRPPSTTARPPSTTVRPQSTTARPSSTSSKLFTLVFTTPWFFVRGNGKYTRYIYDLFVLDCKCGIENNTRIINGKPVDPVRFDIHIRILFLFII